MMYRRMGPKELEKVIEEVKKLKRGRELENMNEMVKQRLKNKDIVDILKEAGFGVVEGKDAVLAKIDEIAEKSPPLLVDRP